MWQADRRLWLTADRTRVVEDGDPAAAFLLAAGRGDEISAEDADRYGLRDTQPAPEPEAAPKRKQHMAAEETKVLEPPENK